MDDIFITADTARIVVPWQADLASLIPHAREFHYGGARRLLIPNEHAEAKLCRNLGVAVPSPILTRYQWPGHRPPWDIQRTTAALLTESPRAYVLSTMGTGKTSAVIYALDYLVAAGEVRKVLIAAPLSTLTPVWESELFTVVPRRKSLVLYGTKDKRKKLLETDAVFYVINHHGLDLLRPELIARGFDAVVLDELAVFRNKSTSLWKAADAIVRAPGVKFVWGMTGSPTPSAPTDAWAQVRLLTPERTERSMAMFQDRTMRRLTQFKWVARREANEVVHAAMQPSVRYTRDDVMELPETSYVDREVKLGPEAARAYKLMFDKLRMITTGGESITAVNEGVLQNKLLQVACGYIYTDKHTVHELPSLSRIQALDEVISETDRNVIVFVPYLHALSGIAAHLRKAGRRVGVVSGATSRTARDRIFAGFQGGGLLDTLVAHPQTMAHGLTLTDANTIVWYAPTQSLEIYEQANARITRPGQTSKTLIAHLFATPIEKMTYQRLRAKGRMQGLLLEMFKQQQLEF